MGYKKKMSSSNRNTRKKQVTQQESLEDENKRALNFGVGINIEIDHSIGSFNKENNYGVIAASNISVNRSVNESNVISSITSDTTKITKMEILPNIIKKPEDINPYHPQFSIKTNNGYKQFLGGFSGLKPAVSKTEIAEKSNTTKLAANTSVTTNSNVTKSDTNNSATTNVIRCISSANLIDTLVPVARLGCR